MPTKGPTQVIVETVGAGARKSVCLFCVLGWSVVRHGLLSSDLDAHTFAPYRHKVIGIKAHCLIDGICGTVEGACQNGVVQALGPAWLEEIGWASKAG